MKVDLYLLEGLTEETTPRIALPLSNTIRSSKTDLIWSSRFNNPSIFLRLELRPSAAKRSTVRSNRQDTTFMGFDFADENDEITT